MSINFDEHVFCGVRMEPHFCGGFWRFIFQKRGVIFQHLPNRKCGRELWRISRMAGMKESAREFSGNGGIGPPPPSERRFLNDGECSSKPGLTLAF
jgi:hypothetical protein